MIADKLDAVVMAGRLTGYTIEEDDGYLEPSLPTLTYRMYVHGSESHQNLGAFAAAMCELSASMRLSRVEGSVAVGGEIYRTRQICLTAEFGSAANLEQAVAIVHRRFIAAPAAAPGSWHYPDVRVGGASPVEMVPAFAHRWSFGSAAAVALSLDARAPVTGSRTVGVHILRNWVGFLQGKSELALAL